GQCGSGENPCTARKIGYGNRRRAVACCRMVRWEINSGVRGMAEKLGARLLGRVAIVTGGGEGVGVGIVRRFARGGAAVLLAQRNADQGQQVAAQLRSEFGIKADYIQTDVTKREQVDAMVAAAVDRLGSVDILVNNAGGSFPKRLENHSDEDMAAGLDLN